MNIIQYKQCTAFMQGKRIVSFMGKILVVIYRRMARGLYEVMIKVLVLEGIRTRMLNGQDIKKGTSLFLFLFLLLLVMYQITFYNISASPISINVSMSF